MNEQELHSLVKRMMLGLTGQPNAAAPAKAAPVTAVMAAGGCLDDITKTNLWRQYLIKNPRSDPTFLNLKLRTPVQLDLGRAGARYKTISMLRMWAGHAATQDSVFSHVDDAFAEENGFVPVQTLCQNKGGYLTRPDRDRRSNEANQTTIRKTLGQNPKVVLTMEDDLSSVVIEANAVDYIQVIRAGLKIYGLGNDPVLFIKYRRMGVSDHIGKLTGAEAVCLLVGERSDLITAESTSAYLTHKPHIGMPRSKHTMIFGIHRQNIIAMEAGAYIAGLIKTMLKKKVSGIDLW